MIEEIRVGKHVLRFEQEDLLVIELHGDIETGQMSDIYRIHDDRLLALGRLFVLIDVGDAKTMSSTAKREGRGRPKPLPPHVVTVVGAPYTIRVTIDLLARATRLLTGGSVTLRFFETTAEAHAFLEGLRRQWKPSSPGGSAAS